MKKKEEDWITFLEAKHESGNTFGSACSCATAGRRESAARVLVLSWKTADFTFHSIFKYLNRISIFSAFFSAFSLWCCLALVQGWRGPPSPADNRQIAGVGTENVLLAQQRWKTRRKRKGSPAMSLFFHHRARFDLLHVQKAIHILQREKRKVKKNSLATKSRLNFLFLFRLPCGWCDGNNLLFASSMLPRRDKNMS